MLKMTQVTNICKKKNHFTPRQYVAGGGIRPTSILPVVLDVGTNNESLLNDPLYLGMGHRRLEGEEYYSFVDEWVHAIQNRYPSTYKLPTFNCEKDKKESIS